MRTVYIRRLDGEIEPCPDHTYVTFLNNGMAQVDTPNLAYLVDKSNIEIVADDAEDIFNEN